MLPDVMLYNTSTMKRLFLGFYLLPFLLSGLQAQSSAEYLHRGSGTDEYSLFSAYWNPMREVMSSTGASGISGPADILDKGKFRINLEGGLTFSPQAATTMSLDGADNFILLAGDQDVPTILGGESTTMIQAVSLDPVSDDFLPVRDFTAPEGLGQRQFSFSRLEVSAGVGAGLEFQGRLFLPLESADMPFSGFGLGVKAGISELVPGLSTLPLDLSFQVSYNQIRGGWDLPYEPHPLAPSSSINQLPPVAELTTHQALAQLMISRKIGPVRPFVAVGLSRNESIVAATGDFPFTGIAVDEQTGAVSYRNLNVRNPFYDLSGSFLGHLDVGVSVEAGPIELQLIYQLSQRQSVMMSVGVNF